MQLFGDERINIVGWGSYDEGIYEANRLMPAMNDLDIKFQNISSNLSKYGESNFYKSNHDAIYALNDDIFNLTNSAKIINYICEKDRGFRKDVSKIADKLCTVDTKDFKTENTLGLCAEVTEESTYTKWFKTYTTTKTYTKELDCLRLSDFIGIDRESDKGYLESEGLLLMYTNKTTVRQTDPYFAAVFREGYDALVAQGLTGSGEEEFTYEDYASIYLPNERAYERYSGEWASIWSAGFESFLGIGYFWKAISGKDLITGDILSEAEQKSAAWCGTTELAVSLISAACAASGVGSFFLLLGAEGLSGSMAAMTYESAVISGMSETEAAILALLTGMTSGCALDDIISNSDTTMTKLGNQLGKSSDEMKDVMGGLKRLAADNNFSSVDDMLDAALNNPTRLPAGLHDDIIEAIDGPMGGFNLPKNVDVSCVAGDASFMDQNDKFLKNIRNRTDVDVNGYYDIVAHGTPYGIEITHNGKKILVDSRTAARLIQNMESYDGQAIRLLSCNTGSVNNGFAQSLANKLNVNVYAPTNYLWATPDGKYFVAGMTIKETPDLFNMGKFKLFVPGGNK